VADQSNDIEVERDEHGIVRRIWVALDPDGTLRLSGHDMGAAVSEFWGPHFHEYEWSWTLDRTRIPALLDALHVDADSVNPALELAVKLRAIGSVAEQQFEQAGAEFWSRLGD
jgi:hypothetical protein